MKWKKDIDTDDFWYDLFEGGYIDPQKVLSDKRDVIAVMNAIAILKLFKESGEEQGKLEYR
jgi:hypothetical protein